MSLPEQRQERLWSLVCDGQRLYAQLLLGLQGLQSRRRLFHIGVYARIVEARNNSNGQTELILQGGQPVLPDEITALRAPG